MSEAIKQKLYEMDDLDSAGLMAELLDQLSCLSECVTRESDNARIRLCHMYAERLDRIIKGGNNE